MSYDFIYIGSAPCGEDCAQIGQEGFAERNRDECRRYIDALVDYYGEPPLNAYYAIKAESHEFGTYREVVVRYDEECPEACDYAFKVESGLEHWNENPPVEA